MPTTIQVNSMNQTSSSGDMTNDENQDQNNFVMDEQGNIIEDVITLDNIPVEMAIKFHNKFYDIRGLYKWVFEYGMRHCPLRQVITEDDKDMIKVFHMEVKNTTEDIKNVFIYNDKVYFSDNIKRGDIFILKGNIHIYCYTWYYTCVGYFYILGTHNLDEIGGTYINVSDIIGFISK